MGFLSESIGLGGSQASETEHSDLVLDMTPLSRSVVGGGQQVVESFAHVDDPIGHDPNLRLPFPIKLHVGEDSIDGAGAMEGWSGIHRSDDDLQLTLDAGLLLRVGGNKGESPDAFAVETHVLREGLGEGDLVTLFNKVADGESVLGSTSRGKALICHVEEGE